MHKELKDLEYISTTIGQYPEYVQGGGGNTSVKIDDEIMAIKASGYRLSDVTVKDAIAFVDYRKIREFFNGKAEDTEEVFTGFMKEVTVKKEYYKELRPSIEAGFHALLRKYVIHTHSVYSNILNCCIEQETIVNEIFGEDYNVIIVEYASPGLALTVAINNRLESFYKENKYYPEIIFLTNHGIIVNADNVGKVLELHENVTQRIKKYFSIKDKYPTIHLENAIEGYIGKTKIKEIENSLSIVAKNVLFPDQIVYFNAEQDNNKITKVLIENNNVLYYKTNQKEALTIEETLVAYNYIYRQIIKNELNIRCLNYEQINYIMNMESEKYRKQVIK